MDRLKKYGQSRHSTWGTLNVARLGITSPTPPGRHNQNCRTPT
jgi:hypothetical protein